MCKVTNPSMKHRFLSRGGGNEVLNESVTANPSPSGHDWMPSLEVLF